MLLSSCCGTNCGSGADTPDAGFDAGERTVVFGGVIRNRGGEPNTEATVSIIERPEISARVDDAGRFSLDVPQSRTITVAFSAPGHPLTVEHPILLSADLTDTSFTLADAKAYAELEALAPRPPGSAIFLVTAATANGCEVAGAQLSTDPRSGTAVYASPTMEPDLSYTAIQEGAPGGFLVGVSGTVEATISNLPPSCERDPYPVLDSPITYLGDITAQDGAFHVIYLFVR